MRLSGGTGKGEALSARLLLSVALVLAAFASVATDAGQAPERDVFAYVQALDDAGARQVWPGFNPAEWPIALFDGQRTILLRHPSPPSGFAPLPGQPGVLVTPGRHEAVVGNSTREIGGVRTATVIATPAQEVEGTLLACIEEIFHVFWLSRHTNFRPNEMARYAYPVTDGGNLRSILAEDEALARALEAENLPQAAGWVAEAMRIRRERLPRLTDDDRAFETGLEMMEGTANYVARVAVGQKREATAARLRSERQPDQIRWRFYDTGAALCLLLDRFQSDWKDRIDREPAQTTAELLAVTIAGVDAQPAAFSASELRRFADKAASDIAALSARRREARGELLERSGPRIVIEVAAEAEPLRVARFDPINLLVLDAGEMVHPNDITFTCPNGTVELTNPGFVRGSFAGTVALTRAAGRHPLADGIRAVTVVGVRGAPRVERRDGELTLEAEGVRITLQGADARTEGETIRISLPCRAKAPSRQ
jgi:hypothetical protein